MPSTEGDLARNRGLWTTVNAQFTDHHADRAWAAEELTWGLFGVPERHLGVLGAAGPHRWGWLALRAHGP